MQFEEAFPYARQGKWIYSTHVGYRLTIRDDRIIDEDGEEMLLKGNWLLRNDWLVHDNIELTHLLNFRKEYERRGNALKAMHWYYPESALKAFTWICQRIKELENE